MDMITLRSDHSSVVIDNVLYTWGGNQPGLPKVHESSFKRELTSKISTFHFQTGQWTIKSTTGCPPLGVRGYFCSTIEHKIIFFGGYCGHDSCFHNSLHQFDTKALNWSVLSDTTNVIPVMRRGWGDMITFEDNGIHHLLMIGGQGSSPVIKHPQFQYAELPDKDTATNEVNMYTLSTGKWCIPVIVGDIMQPNCYWTIEKISQCRAITFGGWVRGYTANSVYIVDFINNEMHWQNVKFVELTGQWPKERFYHSSSIIGSSVLIILGGLTQNMQLLGEKCLWLFFIDQCSWTKIDLPDNISNRYGCSVSSLMIEPNCVWLVVLGGKCNPTMVNNGQVKGDFVSSPETAMLIELVYSHGHWYLGFVYESSSFHYLELIYKARMKLNYYNMMSLPEDVEMQTPVSFSEADQQLGPQPSSSDNDISKILLKPPEHNDLLEVLVDVSHKWELIGVVLEVGENIIQGLKEQTDDKLKLHKVLLSWEETKNHLFSWKTIIETVEGKIVNHKAQAKKIREYLSRPEIFAKYSSI